MAVRAVLSSLLALAHLVQVRGHGAVTRPTPRYAAAFPYCPWCNGEHLPLANPYGAVHRDARPSSPCLGTSRGDPVYPAERFSSHSDIVQQAEASYTAGGSVATTILLNADHNGDARWSYCPHSEDESEECFGSEGRVLTEWEDVTGYWGGNSNCDHCYDGEHFPQTVPLPSDMPPGKVTLRWLWVCKWTDEIFVSCIDVDIAAPTATGGAPSPAPTAPLPTTTLTTTRAPTTMATTTTTAPVPTPPPTRPPTQPSTRPPTQAPTTTPAPAPTRAPPTSTPTPTPVPTSTSPPAAGKCAGEWQKCGGQGWDGPTCCAAGLSCTVDSRWHSWCSRDEYAGPCREIWQQCGGKRWVGATCCAPGLRCKVLSRDYSMCEPFAGMLAQVGPHKPGFLKRAPSLLQAGVDLQAVAPESGTGHHAPVVHRVPFAEL